MPSIEDLKQVFSREQPSFDTWSHSRSNNGNERYTEGGRGGRGGGGKTNPFDDSSQDESKVAGGGGGGGGVNPFADSFSMASSSVVPAGRNPFANESESKQADVHHAVVSPSGLPPRPFNNPRHSWDSDREFPVMEITRIKKKTKKLRESRGGSGTSQNTNSIFRDERDFGSGNEAAFMAVQTSATGTTGGGSNTGQSVRKHKSGTWSADASLNRRSVEPPDSLDEVMDRTENSTTDGESAGLPRGKEQRSATRDSTSPAAKKAQQNLMQGFHRRGKHRSRDTLDEAVEAAVPPSERLNTSDPSTEATHMSGESANKNLTLHDLCGEATTTDDVAWRNALYLLSVQPHLATISDEGWTPLHICCLGASAPPSFMVRAMLYCNRGAARQVDEGDRLPLHLVAASSGDVETMQLLVEEYPQGIYQLDVHGQTPLHLLLRNVATELTSEKARVLLGLTLPETADFEQQKRVLQRRGEHLDLKLNELGRMMSRTRPVSILERERLHESEFETYPQDVQISLKKLEQWKKRQRKQTSEDEEAVEVVGYADGETNPAAIPTVAATQLPIHMLVRRAIVDRVPVESSSSVRGTEPFDEDEEDDDDCKDDDRESSDVEVSSEAPRASVPNPIAVLRLFAAAYPEGLVLRDAQGFTPLLAALLAKDIIPSVEVIEILLGKRSAGYESPPIWAQDMSLHRIAEAKYMNPAMVPMADSNQLPLHVASEEMLSNFFLIESIHESYPGAIQIQDSAGKTPLHLALSNYRRIPADPRVVSLLLSDRVAQIRDDDGKLPFDLLVESGKSLPSQLPRHWSFAEIAHEGSTATDVSSVYQRLFTVSILGEARPNNSAEAKSFLRRLGSLPVWLRRQACQANFVQELLIEELSSPLNCSFVILDGMLLVLLITVFRIQMKQFVDSIDSGDVLQSWYTYTVYAAAATRIAFQALFWVLSVSLAEFQQAVLLNGWGWIDCSAMMITLFTSVVLYGSRDIDQLLTLGTVSTGLLWLTLIGYLARWWYGMAILTGALSKIACRIVWPALIAGILIVAFAQMFHTLLQLDCTDAIPSTTVCSVRDAYRVVYSLIRGEPLVSQSGSEEMTAGAIALVALLLFFLALLLLALFVTILIAASQFDLDDIATGSYWEPKLSFILSMNELSCRNTNALDRLSCDQRFTARLELAWDLMMMSLFGGEAKKENHWYASTSRSSCLSWPLWIVAIFVVPIWFALGCVTLGLLWPPQLRRIIFRPVGRSSKARRRNMAAEESTYQVSRMRNEITQLKAMSYERAGDVHREIRDLKELLVSALKEE